MKPSLKFMHGLESLARNTSKFAINPEDNEEYIINDAVAIDMRPLSDREDYIHFVSVRSVNPGNGAGSAAMKEVMNLVDRCGVTLVGKIIPYHTKDMDTKTLRNWYRKLGCHPANSNNEDGLWVRGPGGTKVDVNLGYFSRYRVLNGLSNEESRERILFYVIVLAISIMIYKTVR
jgi:hypothetical protein